jgi:cell division protein FtsB
LRGAGPSDEEELEKLRRENRKLKMELDGLRVDYEVMEKRSKTIVVGADEDDMEKLRRENRRLKGELDGLRTDYEVVVKRGQDNSGRCR